MTTAPKRAERLREQTRREIIDAAFEEFAERGYHATGIAHIAARLGMGHGTFYRYFDNKRDIIDHVITDLIARIASGLAEDNAPGAAHSLAEYRAQVQRIAVTLGTVLKEDPRIARLLLQATAGVDQQLTERIYALLDTGVAMTAAYLAHGVSEGYLRPDLDVENTAEAIVGMITASVVLTMRHPERSATAMAAAIQQLMYDGISAR